MKKYQNNYLKHLQFIFRYYHSPSEMGYPFWVEFKNPTVEQSNEHLSEDTLSGEDIIDIVKMFWPAWSLKQKHIYSN